MIAENMGVSLDNDVHLETMVLLRQVESGDEV